MGAWDIGPFDNDDALDWFINYEDSDDPGQHLARTISIIQVSGGKLSAPDSCCALAAITVICSLCGQIHPSIPNKRLIRDHKKSSMPLADIVNSALAVLRRIESDSELWQLYNEMQKQQLSKIIEELRRSLVGVCSTD